MSRDSSKRESDRGSLRGRSAEANGDSLRLLRNAHIFASCVREVLEHRVLRAICDSPLTRSQFHLLRLMSLDGDCQMHEVASLLGVTAPAATKTIDKLVDLGLIRRRSSVEDRRATLLALSPKGRRLVDRYLAQMSMPYTHVFDTFSASERKTLADMLERFSLGLLEQVDQDTGACLRCAAFYDDQCSVGKLRGSCPYQETFSQRHLKN